MSSGILCFRINNKDKTFYPQPFGEISTLGFKLAKFIAAHSTETLRNIIGRIRPVNLDDTSIDPYIETDGRVSSLKSLAYTPPDILFSWLSDDFPIFIEAPDDIRTENEGKFLYTVDLTLENLSVKFPLTERTFDDIIEIDFKCLREKIQSVGSAFDFEVWMYKQRNTSSQEEESSIDESKQKKSSDLEGVIISALNRWAD
jgi:hypothetical protein